MKEILKMIKFEYIFAIMLLIVLSIALFVFKENEETVKTILALLGTSITAITTFFFTKTQVEKNK